MLYLNTISLSIEVPATFYYNSFDTHTHDQRPMMMCFTDVLLLLNKATEMWGDQAHTTTLILHGKYYYHYDAFYNMATSCEHCRVICTTSQHESAIIL